MVCRNVYNLKLKYLCLKINKNTMVFVHCICYTKKKLEAIVWEQQQQREDKDDDDNDFRSQQSHLVATRWSISGARNPRNRNPLS